MSVVYPRNNLPEESVPWGRDIEARVKALEAQATTLRAQFLSYNRYQASQTGEIGKQIQQLQYIADQITQRNLLT